MSILFRVGQGIAVILLYIGMLWCIKKADANHGLPERISWIAMLVPFSCGVSLCPGTAGATGLLVLYIAYLAAMAYTDYHSKCVYSLFYIVVAVPGYVWLLQQGDWSMIKAVLIFDLLIVVCSVLLKAFKDGDMEVFITSAPYISLLAYRMKEEIFFLLLLFLFLAVLFSVLGTIVLSIRRKRFMRKNVMVPFIYGALCCVVLLENLF